jgi:hypothetical protein
LKIVKIISSSKTKQPPAKAGGFDKRLKVAGNGLNRKLIFE